MKRKAFIVGIIVFVLLSVMFVGLLLYRGMEDKIKGEFFRKIYGSIGVVDAGSCTFTTMIYCFNSNIDFIYDKDNLRFDNEDVIISDISVSEESSENDMKAYYISFSVVVKKEGHSTIEKLYYDCENVKKEYLIGSLNFVYINKQRFSVNHSVESLIRNNEAVFKISAENKTNLIIEDLELVDSSNIGFSFEKGKEFIAGESLKYSITVESQINPYDLIIVKPIFIMHTAESEELLYFTPLATAKRSVSLDYYQIKEYVQND